MFGPFDQNILSFVWISTLLLFYVEGYFWVFIQSTSNLGTMILRLWGGVLYDFSKNSQLFFRIYSGFSWITMSINVGTMMYLSGEAHEWILASQYRGPLSEATHRLAPSTFNQLKYRGLYPIMFQCGASVAEGCSAFNQHWVFDMNSGTFQILHFNTELTLL